MYLCGSFFSSRYKISFRQSFWELGISGFIGDILKKFHRDKHEKQPEKGKKQ